MWKQNLDAALPSGRRSLAAASWNDTVYVVGGDSSDPSVTAGQVFSARIQPNGRLTSWSLIATIPPRRYASAWVHAGRLYVSSGVIDTGGTWPQVVDADAYINASYSILCADINPDGSLQPFRIAGHNPFNVKQASYLVHGEYLYRFGGSSSDLRIGSVEFVQAQVGEILENQTSGGKLLSLGPSSPGLQTLIVPISGTHSAGDVYVGSLGTDLTMSGAPSTNNTSNNAALLQTIQRARINSDGTLGVWTACGVLPGAWKTTFGQNAVAFGRKVFLWNDELESVSLHMADIGPSGIESAWETVDFGAESRFLVGGRSMAIHGRKLYVVGGYDAEWNPAPDAVLILDLDGDGRPRLPKQGPIMSIGRGENALVVAGNHWLVAIGGYEGPAWDDGVGVETLRL